MASPLPGGSLVTSGLELMIQLHLGCGSLVVKVRNSGPECHEFEPSTGEDPPYVPLGVKRRKEEESPSKSTLPFFCKRAGAVNDGKSLRLSEKRCLANQLRFRLETTPL
ncbi:hypothetical protein TNCV_2398361 [Trichonephila clavipes]|uniref:Uncharacterized protein n=1 Tax=Trichonephila clavipes TaxID=2585209 RepID=A0A8X6SSA6_TRICX|nr:hypothetical protein TNCV_2398361 [Trichonephila clavipes]